MDEAISYQRFSTATQARGDSTRRQASLTDAYCRRHGLRLIDTFLDAGLSGYRGANVSDRGALKGLLDAANAGKFKPGTRLIVESLDRLSRQEISVAIRLFLDIIDSGLVIVTLIDGEQVFTKQRIDDDLTGLIIAIVILSRANNESRTKRERALEAQRAALQKARSQKVPITAKCPTWLKVVGKGDDKRFVVDKPRARTIRRIFKLTASGLGQHAIATYLNRHHVRTLSGKPLWRAPAVAHILRTPAVIGRFQPYQGTTRAGEIGRVPDPAGAIDDYFPRIVSHQLYERARASAVSRLTGRRRRGKRVYTNLVSGLGRCAVCGGSLYASDDAYGHVYLRCADNRIRECANRGGFPLGKLEEVVLALDDLSDFVEEASSKRARRSVPIHIAALQAVITRKKRALEKATADLAVNTRLSRSTMLTHIHDLNLEIRLLEGELAAERQRTAMAALNDKERSREHFEAAKAKMYSDDEDLRLLARSRLTKLIRRVVAEVVLHEDRRISVHMRPDASGYRYSYTVGLSGLDSVRFQQSNGKMCSLGRSQLARLVEIVETSGSSRGS